MFRVMFLAIGALLLAVALAHPHQELSPELISRQSKLARRCTSEVAAMNSRRWAKRQEKALAARAGNQTWSITTEAPYYSSLQNETCVLTEEVTAGPYVWPRAQTLRQDITDGQAGIPMTLDIGVMDVETCTPLPDAMVNIWHCNATGSYSSFTGLDPNTKFADLLTEMNITMDGDLPDLHTDETTFLRGMWPTDDAGITEFQTIVPGFYVERAIHIHVQVFDEYSLRANGTMATGTAISTGQLFLKEDLSEQLMALEPYASHTQINRTTNAEDSMSIYQNETANGWDATLSVVPMDGVDVANGIVGYITLGVDTETREMLKRSMQ